MQTRDQKAFEIGPKIMADYANGSYPSDFQLLREQIIYRQVDTDQKESLMDSYAWVKAHLVDNRGQPITDIKGFGPPPPAASPDQVQRLAAFDALVGDREKADYLGQNPDLVKYVMDKMGGPEFNQWIGKAAFAPYHA